MKLTKFSCISNFTGSWIGGAIRRRDVLRAGDPLSIIFRRISATIHPSESNGHSTPNFYDQHNEHLSAVRSGGKRSAALERKVPEVLGKNDTVAPNQRKRPKDWPGLNGGFAEDFKVVMRSREFEPAMQLYEDMIASGQLPRATVLSGLLTICHKKSHLSCAENLFKNFKIIGSQPNESAYMSLIRCYSDDGQIDRALSLIDEMKSLSMELKLRTYHPILEAASRSGDFSNSLLTIKQMFADDVIPRSDHFTLCLEAAAASGFVNASSDKDQIDKLLRANNLDLLDMDLILLQRIVAAFRGISLDDVEDEGRLSPGDYDTVKSVAHSLPTTATTVRTDSDISSVLPRPCDSFTPPESSRTEPTIFKDQVQNTLTKVKQPIRLVEISSRTCYCPNCAGKLLPLFLDSKGRERVRLGIISITSTASPYHSKCIQQFGDWLKTQKEFKYIIDGANVAYHHQNFEGGKFSYRQIELIVEVLKKRNNGRILVLLPCVYAKKTIPNKSSNGTKIKYKKNCTNISENDERILKKLEEENMLYVVPYGANDDWYWMYATVTEGRESTAYVVTNDMIRDHRLAFLEPRPFIRWRSTQVMRFSFSQAAKENLSDPETYIFEAVKFSMEAQQTSERRWHIPAVDGRTWLCMGDTTVATSSWVGAGAGAKPRPTTESRVTIRNSLSSSSSRNRNGNKSLKLSETAFPFTSLSSADGFTRSSYAKNSKTKKSYNNKIVTRASRQRRNDKYREDGS